MHAFEKDAQSKPSQLCGGVSFVYCGNTVDSHNSHYGTKSQLYQIVNETTINSGILCKLVDGYGFDFRNGRRSQTYRIAQVTHAPATPWVGSLSGVHLRRHDDENWIHENQIHCHTATGCGYAARN